jgi:hypothetical protein
VIPLEIDELLKTIKERTTEHETLLSKLKESEGFTLICMRGRVVLTRSACLGLSAPPKSGGPSQDDAQKVLDALRHGAGAEFKDFRSNVINEVSIVRLSAAQRILIEA